MTLKQRLNIIIFGSDTPAGKWFDILLIVTIIVSVFIVMVDMFSLFVAFMVIEYIRMGCYNSFYN